MAFVCAKLRDDAKDPFLKHITDAGVDVYASETVTIPPFSPGVVPTGITVEIPVGTVILAFPKSGSSYILGAGVLDALYQGEVFIKIINYRPDPLVIEKGSPVAQLVKLEKPIEPVEVRPLDQVHREPSERGATGGILNTL